MKLYVKNKYNQKVYLNLTALSRNDLYTLIGGNKFYLGNELFNINEVYAENDSNSTSTGVIVGGVVGALGGPIGILIGGILGGFIGNETDEDENTKIINFNNS